jgi:hypothetical protein
MHDLRRRALESNKTVSKRARARASQTPSAAGSRSASRNPSRNPSRQASDDEDGNYMSDETSYSINSIDELLNGDLGANDVDAPPDAWIDLLNTRIEQIIDRKRSSNAGREESLAAYTNILLHHYSQEHIDPKISELVPAILKSVKAETSEKEAILALRALSVTLITDPSDRGYEAQASAMKRSIMDSESNKVKVAAIHALGTLTFFGGAGLDEAQDIMDFFLEIVESDGFHVGADDDAGVVTAALEEWGFLATLFDTMEDNTEPAAEAFVEQLESSDPSVQIAAGENIALLYEKSYTELEDDEEVSGEEDDESDPEDPNYDPNAPKFIKRYDVYRMEHQLKHTLESLSTVSGRSISKVDKKNLHANFSDILNSVNYPTRGPKYSTAVDQVTGKRFGSRLTININKSASVRIDKWWKLHRLRALRRILQSGFITHYQDNENIFEALPVMLNH